MPSTKWTGYERFCPLARALDVVGERWTLVIVHELLGGPRRFNTLKGHLPGMGTNVLSDRLRKLEHAGVVQRTPGRVGHGVAYELTERGRALAPALAELRRWGADELVSEPSVPRQFDLSYALPADLDLDEAYEWRIDGQPVTLEIHDRVLTQRAGPANQPAVVVDTTSDYMRRWAAGDTNWDDGIASGAVRVDGTDTAWQRMLVATNYPGRPANLIEQLLQRQVAED